MTLVIPSSATTGLIFLVLNEISQQLLDDLQMKFPDFSPSIVISLKFQFVQYFGS